MFFFFLLIREDSNSFLRTHWMPKFTKLERKNKMLNLLEPHQLSLNRYYTTVHEYFIQSYTEQSVLAHRIITATPPLRSNLTIYR